jgi:hypothetical protein
VGLASGVVWYTAPGALSLSTYFYDAIVGLERPKFWTKYECVVDSRGMTDGEIKETLRELQQWVDQKHGRSLRVAKLLKVSPQLVSDWFAGRAMPKLTAWLKIKEFLKKSEKARKKAIKEDL